MGFLSNIFGGSKKPKLLAPQLEPEAKEFQTELFPVLERGLRGGGLTPEIDKETRLNMLRGLGEEFKGTRRGLESSINRAIPRADVKVRSFLKKALDAQFARQRESIGREFEFRGFEDKERATDLAFGAVGTERRVATDILSATNQSILRRATGPSFGSELAGGLGGAAGILAAGGFGKQPSNFSGANPNVGVTGSPGVTSSFYGQPATGAVGYFQQFGSR